MLAALRGHKTVAEICREHDIQRRCCAAKSNGFERTLWRETMELDVAGEALRGWK